MKLACPKSCKDSESSSTRPKVVRHGAFFRTSDGQWIQRYRCLNCKRNFSSATFNPCYRQRKRHKNELLRRLFSRAVSQRGAAKIVNINRKTAVRKFRFLAVRAEISFQQNQSSWSRCKEIEIDDMETFAHSKCKPLSITIAVESHTRRILGFEVSTMRAKGLLVEKAKRYGYRRDTRSRARKRLFEQLQKYVTDDCLIKSDQNPHYEKDVCRFFPKNPYKQFKGKKGAITGQGELKKIKFDPLFSLNHTFAMLRANVSRLLRKSWCVTKNPNELRAHLMIYCDYHNSQLLRK